MNIHLVKESLSLVESLVESARKNQTVTMLACARSVIYKKAHMPAW